MRFIYSLKFILMILILGTQYSATGQIGKAFNMWGLHDTCKIQEGPRYHTNGIVNAVVSDGTTTYIGGSFTEVRGESRLGVAAFDASGNLLPFTANVSGGEVKTLAIDGNKLIVGGSFTAAGAKDTKAALIDTSGNLITSFPEVNGTVYTAISDGAGGYFIGGRFSKVGGLPRNNLARINSDGSVHSFRADTNGTYTNADSDDVYDLLLDGTNLYVAGKFDAINDVGIQKLARVNASTGAVDTGFNMNITILNGSGTSQDPATYKAVGVNSYTHVRSLALDGSILYFGGTFQQVLSQPRFHIAAINKSTLALQAFNPELIDIRTVSYSDGMVRDLEISASTVYIAGSMDYVAGENLSTPIIEVNKSTSLRTSWTSPYDSHPFSIKSHRVNDIELNGGRLYATGSYFTPWSDRISAVELTGDPAAVAWYGVAEPSTEGRKFAIIGTDVYSAGVKHSTTADNTAGTGWNWDPNTSGAFAYAFAVNGNLIVSDDSLNIATDHGQAYLAAFDRTQNSNNVISTWNPQITGSSINDMLVAGGKLFIGGAFSQVDATARANLAAIDPATGNLLAWQADASSTVHTLTTSGTDLLVGGAFTTIGGQTRNRVASLDQASATVQSWNPNSNNIVYALEVDKSSVFLGGNFTMMGGQIRNYIAKVTYPGGAISTWNPALNNSVMGLSVVGRTVFVGGNFTTVNGQAHNRLARISSSSGVEDSDFTYSANTAVNSVSKVNENLIWFGGSFTSIDGDTSRGYLHQINGCAEDETPLTITYNHWNIADAWSACSVSASTYGAWSTCSSPQCVNGFQARATTRNSGSQTRTVQCLDSSGSVVSNGLCDAGAQPAASRTCLSLVSGNWQTCTAAIPCSDCSATTVYWDQWNMTTTYNGSYCSASVPAKTHNQSGWASDSTSPNTGGAEYKCFDGEIQGGGGMYDSCSP